jgi:hypothetical protein
MMIVLLVAGIGFLLAGLLAVGLGIPVKEFSFGNTLILTGAMVACTGAIMLAIWAAVRELKNIAPQIGPGIPKVKPAARAPADPGATLGNQAPEDGGFLFGGDQPAAENPGHPEPAGPPPWHEETASRDRVRVDAPPPEPVEAAKPKRNLLFASSSRKERERAQVRPGDLPAAEPQPPSVPAPPVAESAEPPPATFDDAWPKPERTRAPEPSPPPPPPRRSVRTPSTFTEPVAAPAASAAVDRRPPAAGAAAIDRYPPAAGNQDQAQVTVLKSGVVDGMAYSLYSDGSIEAQMPEGMMRFASIDELRAHLDQRP